MSSPFGPISPVSSPGSGAWSALRTHESLPDKAPSPASSPLGALGGLSLRERPSEQATVQNMLRALLAAMRKAGMDTGGTMKELTDMLTGECGKSSPFCGPPPAGLQSMVDKSKEQVQQLLMAMYLMRHGQVPAQQACSCACNGTCPTQCSASCLAGANSCCNFGNAQQCWGCCASACGCNAAMPRQQGCAF